MIHEYDSHFWMAKMPSGEWISAEDHSTAEPIFQTARKVRIEPLSADSVRAAFEADVPEGYTAFIRTDVHQDVQTNSIVKVGYILALERGKWDSPGNVSLGGFYVDEWRPQLPLIDGFRAEICGWNGRILFESPDFSYEVETVDGIDIYRFMKV